MIRKHRRRVEAKRKFLGEAKDDLFWGGGEIEHLVIRYPVNASSSF
jgi:hypothetical protein